jgi:hypothetical protein
LTPLTPSYAHGALICECGSSMFVRFSHAREVRPRSCGFLMRTRGDCGSLPSQDGDSQSKLAYIKGGKSRNEMSRQGENWRTDKEEEQAEAEVDEKMRD